MSFFKKVLLWVNLLCFCGFFACILATKCCNLHCTRTRIHLALLSKANHPKMPIHVHWIFSEEELVWQAMQELPVMTSRRSLTHADWRLEVVTALH